MFSLRQASHSGKQRHHASTLVLDRLDALIDELLNDGNLSSSSLASILTAARDSVLDGYHVALARRMWDANNDLKLRKSPEEQDMLNSR